MFGNFKIITYISNFACKLQFNNSIFFLRSPYPHPDVDWQAVEEIDYSKSLSKSQSASSKPRESQYSFSTETSVRPRPRVPSPPPLRPASTRPSPTPSPQTASSTSSHCSSPPRLSAPPPPSLSIPPPLPPKIPDIPKSSLSLNEILPSLQVRKAPPPPSLDQSRKRKRNAVVNEDDNDSSDLIDLLGKKTKSRVSASSRNYARPTRRCKPSFFLIFFKFQHFSLKF